MSKHKYPVLPGCKFGTKVEYMAGDLVELTEEEAGPHIGIVLGPAVVEKAPVSPATPAPTGKDKGGTNA